MIKNTFLSLTVMLWAGIMFSPLDGKAPGNTATAAAKKTTDVAALQYKITPSAYSEYTTFTQKNLVIDGQIIVIDTIRRPTSATVAQVWTARISRTSDKKYVATPSKVKTRVNKGDLIRYEKNANSTYVFAPTNKTTPKHALTGDPFNLQGISATNYSKAFPKLAKE